MATLRSTASLRADGYGGNEVARMVRSAELLHLRRGAYLAEAEDLGELDRHRQLIAATLPLLAEDAVVSHTSAAVAHRLPLLGSPPARVEVTRSTASGGKRRGGVHLHVAKLPPAEVVDLDGLRVTSLARTVVDLARSTPYEAAVVFGDAALAAGLSSERLEASLELAARRPGIAAARRAVAALDGRSESPGESLSRIMLATAGTPRPELQHVVSDEAGSEVARCDFAWPELGVLGEFDGRSKYGRLVLPGESPGDAVFREKLREDRLRELGWLVVRWIWADLDHPTTVLRRLERAFSQGTRRL